MRIVNSSGVIAMTAVGWHKAPHAAAQTATALGLATGLTFAAEVLWTAFRPLPHHNDLDASGVLGAHLDGPPVRVVVLGDSTLTGPGLTSADDIWVRRALAALDLGRPVEIVSFAVGGSRTSDVHRRLDAALATPADAVVLAVGSNDAIHGTPARQFTAEFDAMLTELLERVPVAAVTNIGDLGNIARFPVLLRGVMRLRGRTFCRIVEAAVARHPGATLLDISPANHHFRDRTLFGTDLFHPTSTGHSIWADAALPSLGIALSQFC